jgi:hypothetical protein
MTTMRNPWETVSPPQTKVARLDLAIYKGERVKGARKYQTSLFSTSHTATLFTTYIQAGCNCDGSQRTIVQTDSNES